MNNECGNQKECRLRQRELFNLLQTVKFWCKIIFIQTVTTDLWAGGSIYGNVGFRNCRSSILLV